jgi:hypothetical protein
MRTAVEHHIPNAIDEENSRWQDRIATTIRAAGIEPLDASGNESGDPLDWTNDQIHAALQALKSLTIDRRPRVVPKHTSDCTVWCTPDRCFELNELTASQLGDLVARQEETIVMLETNLKAARACLREVIYIMELGLKNKLTIASRLALEAALTK